MIDTYTVENESIIEVLNDIQGFKESMELFMLKYPKYSYNIDIKHDKDYNTWMAKINIQKNEQETNSIA